VIPPVYCHHFPPVAVYRWKAVESTKFYRRVVETEAQYTESDVGVFYHAWLASAKAKHVYVIHARSQMIQENVAAALTGDVIPMVGREVHYAASEIQLLEDSIRNFKAKLHTLTGADSSSTTRRKKSRAVWEETKEAAKKTVDTELLKEMGLEEWAQATNEQHARRLSEHSALKNQTFMEVSAKMKSSRAHLLISSGRARCWRGAWRRKR
jgi:hypothetical protein